MGLDSPVLHMALDNPVLYMGLDSPVLHMALHSPVLYMCLDSPVLHMALDSPVLHMALDNPVLYKAQYNHGGYIRAPPCKIMGGGGRNTKWDRALQTIFRTYRKWFVSWTVNLNITVVW